MGRRRSLKNRGCEKYVRVNPDGYVTYKHPLMPNYESFGCGPDAIKAANECARIINAELSPEKDRVKRILLRQKQPNPNNLPLFSDVIQEFKRERMPELDWAKSYKDTQINRMKKFVEYGGQAIYENIDVKFMRDMVNDLFKGGSRRAVISLLRTIDAFACGNGFRLGPNVASRLLKPRRAKRKRQRIKDYDEYLAIRSTAEAQWEEDLLDFALITLQPREVICMLDINEHIKKEDDRKYLRFQRGKTGVYIEIEISESLDKIISRRKKAALKLGSRKLFCRQPTKGESLSIKPDWLSRHITDMIQRAVNKSGNLLYGENHPTLHEIRSLGGRLMEQRGFPKQLIQDLMGHKKSSTTEIYLNPDEPKYRKAKAVLELK